MHFTIWRSKDDQFYWELKANNNKIIAVSETYTRKAPAEHSIELIQNGAKAAHVVDCSDGTKYDRDLP
ncbi:MAG: hypothetical protein QOF13_317 [Solirubrobacterales bacterium]|jgi:uncharacterized protein YegP (UPF0339 family)|nr:hypothetical protein [Solirubrobacterales bacterium]